MCSRETNFQTCQANSQLPREQQPSPHLDVVKFFSVVYAKMEPELNLDTHDLAATWDNIAKCTIFSHKNKTKQKAAYGTVSYCQNF